MRKLLFSSLLFSGMCAAGCLAIPQTSGATEAARDAATGVANKPIMLHPHRQTRAARIGTAMERRFAAMARETTSPRQAFALANEATQPDIAVPPPAPPPMAAGRGEKAGESATVAKARPGSDSKSAALAAATNVNANTKAEVQVPLPHEVRLFCANTANAATDARIAWQAAKLAELAVKLRQRIAELEAKRAEYEDWLHKHDEALKEANEDMVAIYSRMRPDAAAAQLGAMDEVMAASLLAKLNSRVASAILAEMDPGRAARIANAMVGPVGPMDGKKS